MGAMTQVGSIASQHEPECVRPESGAVELLISARVRDLGGFSVRRVLPSMHRRLVGPFIFFDQMGPARFEPGRGIDVRPHPHIALSTLTYLFEGEILHRDSLGSVQPIRPGDVNWMFAGRGITHSERTGDEVRRAGGSLSGIQCWLAAPSEREEEAPSFEHHPASSIPRVRREGVTLDVVAGTAYGERSPVGALSPMLYVHAQLGAGATLAVDEEHEERALYVAEGAIGCDEHEVSAGTLLVLRPGAKVSVRAGEPSRVMLLGGARLAGERHIFWNFVSSSPARLERAKEDWKNGRFPKVPGDEIEFIPLPQG
jgi:redox-sensitive bicupin YhaK (pirin superfamily)